jgi:hypothetical protein
MKRYISLLALIVFFQASAMNEAKATSGASDKPYVRTICIRKGRGTVYASLLGFMTACSVVEIKRRGHLYMVNTAHPTVDKYDFVVGLETAMCEFNSVIPKNITLWDAGPDSYDVLYRREDGVIVAKDLKNGEELYHIKYERTEGDGQEQLVQAADGWVMVTNKDGNCKSWSHRELRNCATGRTLGLCSQEGESE